MQRRSCHIGRPPHSISPTEQRPSFGVPTGLSAGAKGIRTAGPPVKRDGVFRDHPDRPPAPSPPGESSERDRGFESTSLHQGVMNKSSQAANLPQAANRPTLTGEGRRFESHSL